MFYSKTLEISQAVVTRKTKPDRSFSEDYLTGF